jgi:hypothetical protein
MCGWCRLGIGTLLAFKRPSHLSLLHGKNHEHLGNARITFKLPGRSPEYLVGESGLLTVYPTVGYRERLRLYTVGARDPKIYQPDDIL